MKRKMIRSVLVISLLIGGGALSTTSASAIYPSEGGGTVAGPSVLSQVYNFASLSGMNYALGTPSLGAGISAAVGAAGGIRAFITVLGLWLTIG